MDMISNLLGNGTIGRKRGYKNLAMYPITGANTSARKYSTLDEALNSGSFKVTEVSESGSVPELLVKNQGDKPVILLDGEELVGAKQNRVVTISLLVPANSEVVIPVACVESGRWAHQSQEFSSGNTTHFSKGRARKLFQVSESLNRCSQPLADQSEIWNDISAKGMRMGIQSRTEAMSDMYEHHDIQIKDYIDSIKPIQGQVGGLFAIDGKVVGLELFDNDEVFDLMLPKIVSSYAIDAIETANGKSASIKREQVVNFLKDAMKLAWKEFPAVGLGKWLRSEDQQYAGGALIEGERVVHMCMFRNEQESRDDSQRGNILRSSRRGRFSVH